MPSEPLIVAGQVLTPELLLRWQQQAGNHAVVHLLRAAQRAAQQPSPEEPPPLPERVERAPAPTPPEPPAPVLTVPSLHEDDQVELTPMLPDKPTSTNPDVLVEPDTEGAKQLEGTMVPSRSWWCLLGQWLRRVWRWLLRRPNRPQPLV